jgi:hypothetical protein
VNPTRQAIAQFVAFVPAPENVELPMRFMHVEQTVEPDKAYVPFTHPTHTPFAKYIPALQFVHDVDPATE